MSVISSVRINDAKRSAQNLSGFLSMHTFCWMSLRNRAGVSWTTCCTLNRVLMYSINRFMKLKKWSAVRILPGTAPMHQENQVFSLYVLTANGLSYSPKWVFELPFSTSSGRMGLAKTISASFSSLAFRRPANIFSYSRCKWFSSSSLNLISYKIS